MCGVKTCNLILVCQDGGMSSTKANIYLIESKTRQGLAEMFIRFQEHYESPEFKGKTFTVEEFAHWYATKYGSFTYTQDWYGFNIPATVLEPFRNGSFDPLTTKEQKLLELCRTANAKSYIIGVTPAAEYFKETVRHEFAHGAFHTNQAYRSEVISCVREHRLSPIVNGLKKMGYHADVAVDETNAYVLVEPDTIQNYISIRNTEGLREKLSRIFVKHFGFSLIETEIPALMNRIEHIML